MKQNKKTLYWLHSHFLYWMGGTKYVFEVLRRLSKEYNIIAIVENSSDYSKKIYQDAGIELISLNKLSSISLIYWLTFPYQIVDTYLRVKNKAVDQNAKIVVGMFPMNVVALLLKRPYFQLCFEPFAFFHDPDFTAGFPVIKRLFIGILKVLYSHLDIVSTRGSKTIITLNQVTQKGIKNIYNRDSIPVYTGIDIKHFHPYVSPELKRKYAKQDVIIHSTDYTPVKGTDKMINIFAKVKKLCPKAVLLITSTIKNPTAIKNLEEQAKKLGIRNSVKFLGFVDYDILPQLYSLSRVLVQCSFSERSGTTSMALPVKEAMACGTWCIRSPVTTEDVIDGVTGYLVDPRNKEQMVIKIVQVLGLDSEIYNRGSKLARSTIVNRYSWDHTVEDISSIIK